MRKLVTAEDLAEYLVRRFAPGARLIAADIAVEAPDVEGLVESVHYEADEEESEDGDGSEERDEPEWPRRRLRLIGGAR